MADLTPVIIGVGEASERIEAPDYAALSPADLAGRAAKAALEDAGPADRLAREIDVLCAIRQFEISGPTPTAPFGCSNNFPRSVARRIGADPKRAILEPVGGQGPQHLVNEFAHSIAAGETRMALFTGSEAISTVRHLMGKGEKRDWSETVEGPLEDRGLGGGFGIREFTALGARTPINFYALFENARRGRLGLDRAAYRLEMAKLFAPFTEVAARNRHAMSRERLGVTDIAEVTERNRLTSDPFPRRVVARDQANQGAAVLMTSVETARALGVPEEKFIYLYGGADAKERGVIERADLSRSPASTLAAERALAAARMGQADIELFDFYSCFPIAVFNVRDGLGIAADDPRPLTLTGGLPFFGGAGNNYSMHAIASMVRALRERPSAAGLVAANGGFLSKYSVGVYGARPRPWAGFDSTGLQAEIDAWPAPQVAAKPEGEGVIETYMIDYAGKAPHGVAVGRLDATGERFVAMTPADRPDFVQAMIDAEPIGARVRLASDAEGRAVIADFRPA